MRLIDADALKSDHNMGDECNKCKTKWRECQYDYIYSKMDFCTWIDDAPTIDAVEVVHGEWIHGREIGKEWNCGYWITYFEDWHCSNCGVVFEQESKPKYHFCPNCGAKMDGEEKNDEK